MILFEGLLLNVCIFTFQAGSWLVTFAWVCQTGFNALTFIKSQRRYNCPGSPGSNGTGSSQSGAAIVSIEKY